MTSHYNFQILPLGQIQWKSTEKNGACASAEGPTKMKWWARQIEKADCKQHKFIVG